MKKILTLLFFALFSFVVLGCSETSSTNPSTTLNTPSTEAPTTQAPTTQTTTALAGYVIDNQVLVDNENLTIKIVEVEDDPLWSFTIKIFVENKTSDTNLVFTLDTAVINGYEYPAFWYESVEFGKKSNSEINFYSWTTEDLGITTFDKIDLYFRVYDDDDWDAEDLLEEKYTIYPTGLSESEIVSPPRPTSENEYVVIDNEFVTFIIIDTYMDDIWGYTLRVYIENKTSDIEMMFTWDDVSVNDYMIDPFWAKSLIPGAKTISEISFDEEDLEDNGITEVLEIEFNLRVYDYDYLLEDDIVDAVFTYNP